MKIVVTGAAGLQGSHLCEQLVELGHDVRGLDNYSRGNFKAMYIRKGDVRDPLNRDLFFGGVDACFHLAAEVWGVKATQAHNWDQMRHNMEADMAVLSACVEGDVGRVIYPSTACVYPVEYQNTWDAVLQESMAWGHTEALDIEHETFPGPHPESGYGWAKLMGEVQVKHLPIPWVIFRLFNVYGDGENAGAGSHVIPELIRKTLAAKSGERIQVYGDGSAGRTFLHVDDAVSAYIAALTCEPGQVMNLGDSTPIRIRDLAKKIVKMDGRGIGLSFDPSQPEGVKGRTPDIGIARRVLGWEPQVTLDEGLRRTYEDYWTRLNGS